MKKLILAFVALAFAFAISSCCDQSQCPQNRKCTDEQMNTNSGDETPYRWDQNRERQSRRW